VSFYAFLSNSQIKPEKSKYTRKTWVTFFTFLKAKGYLHKHIFTKHKKYKCENKKYILFLIPDKASGLCQIVRFWSSISFRTAFGPARFCFSELPLQNTGEHIHFAFKHSVRYVPFTHNILAKHGTSRSDYSHRQHRPSGVPLVHSS